MDEKRWEENEEVRKNSRGGWHLGQRIVWSGWRMDGEDGAKVSTGVTTPAAGG